MVRWGGLPTIAWHAISTAAPLLHVTTHLPDFLFAELELPGMLTVCTNTTEPMSQYDTNQSQIRLSQAVRKIRELIHIITYIYISFLRGIGGKGPERLCICKCARKKYSEKSDFNGRLIARRFPHQLRYPGKLDLPYSHQKMLHWLTMLL